MRGRWLVIAAIVLGMLVTAVLAGAARRPAAVRWEYGVFRGEGVWSWHGPNGTVDYTDASQFAVKMGAAYSQAGVEMETNVLNALGEQGWELVTAPEKNKYVLRRPK